MKSTWTAGELVAELRHLPADTDIYIVGPVAPMGSVGPVERIRRVRWSFTRQGARALRRVVGTRVIRDRYAYIESEAL